MDKVKAKITSLISSYSNENVINGIDKAGMRHSTTESHRLAFSNIQQHV